MQILAGIKRKYGLVALVLSTLASFAWAEERGSATDKVQCVPNRRGGWAAKFIGQGGYLGNYAFDNEADCSLGINTNSERFICVLGPNGGSPQVINIDNQQYLDGLPFKELGNCVKAVNGRQWVQNKLYFCV